MGHFFQQFKFWAKEKTGPDEINNLYEQGKEALRLRYLDEPTAAATGKLADAAQKLIKALENVDEGILRLGALLVVKAKIDGESRLLAETVSPEIMHELESNPRLLDNPEAVYTLIEKVTVQNKRIDEHVNISMNHLLDKSLRLIENKFKCGANVTKKYSHNLRNVKCSPNGMIQVFVHILNNSIEAIEKGGNITIKTLQDEKFSYAQISDDGQGISSENKEKVFRPDFTTKKDGGIGLYISQRIVHEHGGTITVDSEPGKETTFTVRLPIK